MSSFNIERGAKLTKRDYIDLIDRGVFSSVGRRTFLFRGTLMEPPRMSWEHAQSLRRVTTWAFDALADRFAIAPRLPIDSTGESLFDPDVAVYPSDAMERRPYPADALLAIEVADDSLDLDREKAHEYAADAREYWILDVRNRVLHIYRNPHDDPAGLHGRAFDPPATLDEHATVAPLCEPTAAVKVSDLLPPP